jgi:hypothetical protein
MEAVEEVVEATLVEDRVALFGPIAEVEVVEVHHGLHRWRHSLIPRQVKPKIKG